MAPGYLNFQTTFLIDLNEDHNRQPLIFPEDHSQCHEQQYAHLNFPLNSNHNPHHLQASSSSTTSSSTYPTNTCPIYFFNNPSSNDQAGYSFAGSQFQPYPIKQEFDDNYGSIGSSSYDQTAAVVAGTLEINKKDENNKNVLKFSISKKQDQSFPVDSTYRHQTLISTHEDQNQISSGVGGDGHSLFADQWMSSKMRHMKKMMKEEAVAGNEQPPAAKARNITCIDSNNYCNDVSNSTATIRVCSDCNTTKTPLWRSGPRGPKTLCNACGIRQRKARRAMAAAAAANNNISASNSQTHHHMSTIRTAAGVGSSNKKTSTGNNNGLLFGAQKKRSKLNNKPPTPRTSSHSNTNNSNSTGTCSTTDDDNGRKTSTNWFEEFASSLSEKLSFDQQVLFPEEEKDAAILLMAISCGLVHG